MELKEVEIQKQNQLDTQDKNNKKKKFNLGHLLIMVCIVSLIYVSVQAFIKDPGTEILSDCGVTISYTERNRKVTIDNNNDYPIFVVIKTPNNNEETIQAGGAEGIKLKDGLGEYTLEVYHGSISDRNPAWNIITIKTSSIKDEITVKTRQQMDSDLE